nr:MAG TPA: hypothetical protein [Caudoviricetes sp.]
MHFFSPLRGYLYYIYIITRKSAFVNSIFSFS